jgi:hypothetical protein
MVGIILGKNYLKRDSMTLEMPEVLGFWRILDTKN